MLAGEEEPDTGNLYLSRNTSTVYMRQNSELTSEKTALMETMSVFSDLMEMEREMETLDLTNERDMNRYHTLQEAQYQLHSRQLVLFLEVMHLQFGLPA